MEKEILLIALYLMVCICPHYVVEKDSDKSADRKNIQVREEIYTEMTAADLEGDETGRMREYYGVYKVVQFCPTIYYGNRKFDVLPEQEADMLVGCMVTVKEELLETYDSERCFGTRDGREFFAGNYRIKKYSIENPVYNWEEINPETMQYGYADDDMAGAVGEIYEKINGRFCVKVSEAWGTHTYYTVEGGNKLVLGSGLSGQFFILEKLDVEPMETTESVLQPEEKTKILESFYGHYIVKEFLPTKFYPALDANGDVILPQQEADMMIGRIVTADNDRCLLYDNFRLPNSEIVQRKEDGYWVKEVEIGTVVYKVERRPRNEIYGLRDDMLHADLVQDEYIEISAYPGYESGGDRILPQFYLLDDGRVLLYSMGEYFLLEKDR